MSEPEQMDSPFAPCDPALRDGEAHERLSYHAPTAQGAERHRMLTGSLEALLGVIERTVPNGREKSIVITKLEEAKREAKMWASAGVARNGETR